MSSRSSRTFNGNGFCLSQSTVIPIWYVLFTDIRAVIFEKRKLGDPQPEDITYPFVTKIMQVCNAPEKPFRELVSAMDDEGFELLKVGFACFFFLFIVFEKI